MVEIAAYLFLPLSNLRQKTVRLRDGFCAVINRLRL